MILDRLMHFEMSLQRLLSTRSYISLEMLMQFSMGLPRLLCMDPYINEPRKANALFNELAKAMSEQCIHEPRKAI